MAINKDVVNTQSTELVLQDSFAANHRQQFWESQGFTVDPNKNADFVQRVMIPELQRWQKILTPTKKD